MTAIFSALNWIPGWVWGAICAGALATSCVTQNRLSAERNAHQSFKSETAERVAVAERERANLTEARRKAEQELTDAQETHAAEVASLVADVGRARAAGRVESVRVRDAARATAKLAGQVCADSTAAGVRETADNAARVLADVLGEFEQRATTLAGVADERGIAGRACERLYQEARSALIKHSQ